MTIQFRTYGQSSPCIILLHGGPGAGGYLAPIGRALSDSFRLLEPFQRRGSRERPVRTADHIDDLWELIHTQCRDEQPVLVGHSWGAMLALAYAAKYPDTVRGLVLIGSGSFDAASRHIMDQTRLERMSPAVKERLANLPSTIPDPDKRLAMMGKIMQQIDSVDLVDAVDEGLAFDALGNKQAWADMIALQEQGVYPAAFSKIPCPAVMLHGAEDPHPGKMIYESLKPHLRQLEYCEFANCGHYPWLEKGAKDEFYIVLGHHLTRRSV